MKRWVLMKLSSGSTASKTVENQSRVACGPVGLQGARNSRPTHNRRGNKKLFWHCVRIHTSHLYRGFGQAQGDCEIYSKTPHAPQPIHPIHPNTPAHSFDRSLTGVFGQAWKHANTAGPVLSWPDPLRLLAIPRIVDAAKRHQLSGHSGDKKECDEGLSLMAVDKNDFSQCFQKW